MSPIEKMQALGQDSNIRVGLVVLLLGLAYFFGSNNQQTSLELKNLREDIDLLRGELVEVRVILDDKTASLWTRSQHESFARALARANPDIRVPSTEDIPYIVAEED